MTTVTGLTPATSVAARSLHPERLLPSFADLSLLGPDQRLFLKEEAGLNPTVLDGLMVIISPVLGFRP